MAIEYITNSTDTSNLTTYTFSSLSLGTVATDRHIVIAGAARSSVARTLDSITVGGVTATQNALRDTSNSKAFLYIAAVPTGSTGDVVVSFSGGMLRCGVGLYRLDDLVSATAHDSGTSSADPTTFDLDIPVNGAAIGVSANFASGGTASWTGVTEDFDVDMEPTDNRFSAGHVDLPVGETDRTIECDWTTSSVPAFVTASWEFNESFTPKAMWFI